MRTIDADKLDKEVLRYADRKHFYGNIEEANIILKTRQIIHAAPTVDAVEVVRCRDCENRSPSPFGHPHLRWCKILGDHCTLDFYCGFGKRREKRNATD